MTERGFSTVDGVEVPAVTAEEMRAVDRVAVEDLGLALLQMMENAGRTLAWHVRDASDGPAVVVCGSGGNGGGGLVCARHLANRGVPVHVVLDREPAELTGAAARQFRIVDGMGLPAAVRADGFDGVAEPAVVVDALVGYGLSGEVREPAGALVDRMNAAASAVVSLDVPSGIDATTGRTLGHAVEPTRTVTLALPKTGLADLSGPLVLADIGIPGAVYDRLDVDYADPFGRTPWVELVR